MRIWPPDTARPPDCWNLFWTSWPYFLCCHGSISLEKSQSFQAVNIQLYTFSIALPIFIRNNHWLALSVIPSLTPHFKFCLIFLFCHGFVNWCCYMDFSKMLQGLVKIDTWVQCCSLYFSPKQNQAEVWPRFQSFLKRALN